MPNEAAWNAAVGDWFFGTRAADRPVYLSLDEEVIADIAREQGWELDDPVADFEKALRACSSPLGVRPFRSWAAVGDRWQRAPLENRGIPPFVAFLGATVLAATRDRPGGAKALGRPAYYEPLRELFKIVGDGTISGYYPDVPNMWRWLNEWLEGTKGVHGLKTAHAPNTHDQHIGYSLSQAVLLSNDRSRLTDFFDAIGAAPRAEMDPSELLARYRRWVAGPGRVTRRVHNALADPDFAQIVADILAAELRYWDGAIRDVRGLRVARVLPHVDAYRGRLDSVAFIPAGVHGRTIDLDGVTLEVPDGPRFIRFPVCQLHLGEAHSWVAGDLRFREDVDPVMVLRPDDDVGGWVPVRRAEYGESHYVLVHGSALAQVQNFFKQFVGGLVKEVTKVPLPEGWHLFRDVVLSTSTVAVPPVLRPLLARTDEMPQLVGGLCVDPLRSIYLDDAAPDVLVPGFEHELEVVLDGAVIRTVHGTGDLLPLHDQKLSVGSHEVHVGSTVLRFSLLASRVSWPQHAQIAHNLHRSEWGYLPDRALGPPLASADVAISGAAVYSDGGDAALEADPPMMVRITARGYLALGPRGFVADVDVEQPAWARRQGLDFNAFELAAIQSQVAFPVLWVARRLGDRAAVLPVSRPVNVMTTATPDLSAWRLSVNALLTSPLKIDEAAREAWNTYVGGAAEHA